MTTITQNPQTGVSDELRPPSRAATAQDNDKVPERRTTNHSQVLDELLGGGVLELHVAVQGVLLVVVHQLHQRLERRIAYHKESACKYVTT